MARDSLVHSYGYQYLYHGVFVFTLEGDLIHMTWMKLFVWFEFQTCNSYMLLQVNASWQSNVVLWGQFMWEVAHDGSCYIRNEMLVLGKDCWDKP